MVDNILFYADHFNAAQRTYCKSRGLFRRLLEMALLVPRLQSKARTVGGCMGHTQSSQLGKCRQRQLKFTSILIGTKSPLGPGLTTIAEPAISFCLLLSEIRSAPLVLRTRVKYLVLCVLLL